MLKLRFGVGLFMRVGIVIVSVMDSCVIRFDLIVDGNCLMLFEVGFEWFDVLFGLIDGVCCMLCILYYIYVDDDVGWCVNVVMIVVVGCGVKIVLIVDGFGSDEVVCVDFFDLLEVVGIVVCIFLVWFGWWYLLCNY